MTPLIPNPMNQLARIAVGLFAIYWVVAGLSPLAGQIAQVSGSIWTPGVPDEVAKSQLTWGAAILVAAVLVAVLPAALIFGARGRIAAKLAPINESAVRLSVSASDLAPVGCVLLALVFCVTGAVALLSGGAMGAFWFTQSESEPMNNALMLLRTSVMGSIFSGVGHLVAGLILWRHAKRPSSYLPSAAT